MKKKGQHHNINPENIIAKFPKKTLASTANMMLGMALAELRKNTLQGMLGRNVENPVNPIFQKTAEDKGKTEDKKRQQNFHRSHLQFTQNFNRVNRLCWLQPLWVAMIGQGNICKLLYYSCPGKPLGLNYSGPQFFSSRING